MSKKQKQVLAPSAGSSGTLAPERYARPPQASKQHAAIHANSNPPAARRTRRRLQSWIRHAKPRGWAPSPSATSHTILPNPLLGFACLRPSPIHESIVNTVNKITN